MDAVLLPLSILCSYGLCLLGERNVIRVQRKITKMHKKIERLT